MSSVSGLRAFGLVLASVAFTSIKGCFSRSPQANITRTAVFMLVFLVVHMLGNLSAFAGPEAFNGYGHLLNKNPALKFVEYYLLLVSVVHIVVGVYLSYTKGKTNLNKGFFLFSGVVILAFIVTHLQTFKFGPDYRVKVAGITEEVRDLFKLEEEVFSNPNNVAWYVLATSVLGWHLWRGWEAAVFKLDFIKDNKENRTAGKAVGHFLIWPLTLGFISTPVWFYYRSTVGA